ncbi:MAG TPA: hypothetical protein VMD04_04355, partial [Candidatus Margulisiibacteriota bacterium]|nr:hypothetical protein [Candidatus Margulisiibacteriota bacterium]
MGLKSGFLRKILSLTLTFTFILTQLGFAQVAVDLNIASHLSSIQAGMNYEKFRAPHLRYFSYDNNT